VDVVAARVNLMLFVTLRLQSGLGYHSTAASATTAKNDNNTINSSNNSRRNDLFAYDVSLRSYFRGLKDSDENDYYYRDDGVEVVKDLFRVGKVTLKLKQLLEMNVEVHSELTLVLLKSNVDYLFERICILCQSILTLCNT